MKAGSLHSHRVTAGTDPVGSVGRRETCPPRGELVRSPDTGLDLQQLWVGVPRTGLEAAYEVALDSRKCLQSTRKTRKTQLMMGKAWKLVRQWGDWSQSSGRLSICITVWGVGVRGREVPCEECEGEPGPRALSGGPTPEGGLQHSHVMADRETVMDRITVDSRCSHEIKGHLFL